MGKHPSPPPPPPPPSSDHGCPPPPPAPANWSEHPNHLPKSNCSPNYTPHSHYPAPCLLQYPFTYYYSNKKPSPMIRLITGKHQHQHQHPFNSETRGFITPVQLHYLRNHHGPPVPRATWEGWTVEVTGLVERPGRFTMDQSVSEFESREFPVKEQNMVKRMVKWLKRIIVTTAESDNYYHHGCPPPLPAEGSQPSSDHGCPPPPPPPPPPANWSEHPNHLPKSKCSPNYTPHTHYPAPCGQLHPFDFAQPSPMLAATWAHRLGLGIAAQVQVLSYPTSPPQQEEEGRTQFTIELL